MDYQQEQPKLKYRKFKSIQPKTRIYNTNRQQDQYYRNLLRPLYNHTPYPLNIERTKSIPTYNNSPINSFKTSKREDEQLFEQRKSRARKDKLAYFKYGEGLDQSIRKRRFHTNQQEEEVSRIRLWRNPDLANQRNNYTKIYRIKPKRQSKELPSLFEQTPVISRIKVGKIHKNRNAEQYYQVVNPSITKPPYLKLLQVHKRLKLCSLFRKVGHAILFVVYLRGFNKRMRISRFNRFQLFVKQELGTSLFQLKSYMINISKPFLQMLMDQHEFDFMLYEKDDPKLKKEKIKAIHNLIRVQIESIEKGIRGMANQQLFTQTLYYICRHGSFAPFYQLLTGEQLNLSCISEAYGYLRGDKHLQRSGVIMLVLVKILLYNMLLQPSKIQFLDSSINKKMVYRNIILVGNILYQLFLEVQDSLLGQAPPIYRLANWSTLTKILPIKTAQPMTVKKGQHQGKDLISGLSDPKFIKQVYKVSQMGDYKRLILELVKLLHENMVSMHKKIRKEHY